MPLLPPHPSPLPQILRVAYKALETVFREVFGGEGAKMRNFKTYASGYYLCLPMGIFYGTGHTKDEGQRTKSDWPARRHERGVAMDMIGGLVW